LSLGRIAQLLHRTSHEQLGLCYRKKLVCFWLYKDKKKKSTKTTEEYLQPGNIVQSFQLAYSASKIGVDEAENNRQHDDHNRKPWKDNHHCYYGEKNHQRLQNPKASL